MEAASFDLKERFYRRNYIALLLDGFFFNFSASIFSYSTVLPVYVSQLTGNTIFISLLAALFFGFSNGASVFSCILGVNTKSPKWTAICICLTQRAGFLLMLLSTYAASGSRELAMGVFFFSYGIYGIAAGMSNPVHSVLVSSTICRNVSSFYGTYNLAGAFAGVLGAQIIRFFLARYGFPLNYRWLFFLGLLAAMLSTFSLALGIRESPEDRGKKMRFSMLPKTVVNIIKENRPYRNFLLIRVFAAMAEMSVPFYIIRISSLENAGEGVVGSMATVLLAANMIASKILGPLGDRFGPAVLVALAALSGTAAAVLSIFIPSPAWGYAVFSMAGLAITGNSLSNSVANIYFAKNSAGENLVSVYTAASGFFIAPFYALFSFLGGLVVNRFSISRVFVISAFLYALSLLINLFCGRRGIFGTNGK